jgi:osmotically-inducible protein OsmY
VTIVRTKDATAGAPTGASDDEVVETMIKGKLQADSETAKAMIEVDANQGEVTLKGSADSAKIVGRAIALALDTEGVTKVSADVKAKAQANQ